MPWSPPIGADKLSDRERVAGESMLQLRYPRAGCQRGLRGQRVEPEPVAVAAVAARWTGTAVTDSCEVVATFQRCSATLAKATGIRGDAPGEPVDESARRRVRIIQDQRQRLSPLR